MKRLFSLFVLGVIAAQPVFAGDDAVSRPRLVPGGVDIAQGDKRNEIMSVKGLSFGTLTPLPSAQLTTPARIFVPSATGTLFDKLALGGYVAYSSDGYSVSSALRNHNGTTTADLTASLPNSVMDYSGNASINLGYDWHRTTSIFSTNSQISGIDSLEGIASGPSVSLSWNHSVTPGFYFGGYATAQRLIPQSFDFITQPSNKFLLGASVGVKF
jgi:hypothetical protein